jgi:hypothetical protein
MAKVYCKLGETITVRLTYEVEITAKEYDLANLNEIEGLAVQELIESETLESVTKIEVLDKRGDEVIDMTDAEDCWNNLRRNVHRQHQTDNDNVTHPDLSKAQLKFIHDALECDLEVHAYSGRGMYGRYCPAVFVDSRFELKTSVGFSEDSMGRSLVLYCT